VVRSVEPNRTLRRVLVARLALGENAREAVA
jgi:hypothetical protein